MTEEKKITFFKDYQKLQATAKRLEKTGNNPFFKSKYVELKDVLSLAKELCAANNFIFIQTPQFIERYDETGVAILQTELIHKDGEKIVAQIPLAAKDKNDPQKIGGAITYMRRYSLTAILGLEEEDDDGNKSSTKTKGKAIVSGKTSVTSKKLTGVATEKQINFIYSLLKKFGANTREEALKMISGKMEKLYTELKFTAQEASDIITKLKEELDGRNQDRLLNDVEEKKEPNLQVIDGDRIPDTILSSEIPQ